MILKMQDQEGEGKEEIEGRMKEEEKEQELKKVDDFEDVGERRRKKGKRLKEE